MLYDVGGAQPPLLKIEIDRYLVPSNGSEPSRSESKRGVMKPVDYPLAPAGSIDKSTRAAPDRRDRHGCVPMCQKFEDFSALVAAGPVYRFKAQRHCEWPQRRRRRFVTHHPVSPARARPSS